jgi:hypothetical protein
MQPVKFQSRIDAGQKVAERLIGLKLDLFGESGSQDIAVLAVPRGGIIIGDIVASELAARLDVVVFKVVSWTRLLQLRLHPKVANLHWFLEDTFQLVCLRFAIA